MSDLKTQLIKLGTTNPELRKHLKPLLNILTGSSEKFATGQHPINPNKAVISFFVGSPLHSVQSVLKAHQRDKSDKEIERAFHRLDPKMIQEASNLEKLERNFLSELPRILGTGPIKKLGRDANGELDCSVKVSSYEEVYRIAKMLKHSETWIKGKTPHFHAKHFILYPEGESGVAYGSNNWHPVKGTIHDWLKSHGKSPQKLAAITTLHVHHINADNKSRTFTLQTSKTTRAHIGNLVKKALYWDGIPAYWVEESGEREITISLKGDRRGHRAIVTWE